MGPDDTELVAFFDGLSDEELQRRASGQRLTAQAQSFADAELKRRNLGAPGQAPAPASASAFEDAPAPATGETHYVLLGRYLDGVAAQTLRARLESEGIPVLLHGANHHQLLGIVSPILGGTGIEVPQEHAERAFALKQAFEAGELTLPETVDVGPGDDAPETGLFSTDRKRLREIAVAFAVVAQGGYMVLIMVLNLLYVWERDPGIDLLRYWPALLPVLYLAAGLMLAWRSKWSILLFALHLLASLTIHFVFWNDAGSLGRVFVQSAVTGVILYYGLYQLGQGRLR